MDKVLKQRLVGASILIALAVIFLPMLFNGGDDAVDQRELALDVPERESGDRQVRRIPIDPDQARQPGGRNRADPPSRARPTEPTGQSEPAPVEAEPQQLPPTAPPTSPDAETDPEAPRPERDSSAGSGEEEQSTDTTEAQDSSDTSEPEQAEAVVEFGEAESADDSQQAEEADAQPTTTSTPTEGTGGWMVQVAVFSSRETAASIRQRLADLGHSVSMDVLIRDQSELFRLRTGPYASEATAQQARGQIEATVAGVDPVVRDTRGDGAADRSGLAVQVGSFASHNNAERLVSQLTAAGHDAFMFGEETGGRTIWRVRVGAFEDRADADRLLETLRDEQGLEGIVVSHP